MARLPVGELICLLLVVVLMALLPALHPTAAAVRELLQQFGLLGVVALATLFPLRKGHLDLLCGPVAGAAGCVAALLSEAGTAPAILAALALGGLVGCVNGLVVGWTRLPPLLCTVVVGQVAGYWALWASASDGLVVRDPVLEGLASGGVGRVPLAVLLLGAAALGAHLLLKTELLLPVDGAPNERAAADRRAPRTLLCAFAAAGCFSAVAGLFMAGPWLATGPWGVHNTGLLVPLAALLLGGASAVTGRGGVRVAVVGSGGLALINWFLAQLRVPLSGPTLEGLVIGLAFLCEGWRMLGWDELADMRRHGALAAPRKAYALAGLSALLPRLSRPVLVLAGLGITVSAYAYIGFYATRYVPGQSAVVASKLGLCQVSRAGRSWEDCGAGTRLGAGDAVATGPASEALVRFSDGSTTRLYAGTTLTIERLEERGTTSRTTRLYLQVGRVFASVRRLVSPDASFEVDSPLLTVAVRGTAFLMVVEAARSYVEVLEGSVDVTRKYQERDAQTGATVSRQENGSVRTGEWVSALVDRRLDDPQPLPPDEQEALKQASENVVAELVRTLGDTSFWRGLFAIAIALAMLYLFFTYVQPPPPPLNPLDVAERAATLADHHRRTPRDSANAAALAEMYLKSGQVKEAVQELEAIVRVDPDSEYGQWAQRLLARLRATERRGQEPPGQG